MRLTELSATSLRGLRNGIWRFDPQGRAPGQRPVTVVTGPSGVGLSTFLEGIALSARRLATGATLPNAGDVVRAGDPLTLLRTTWRLDAGERTYGGVKSETLTAEVVIEREGLGRVSADPALLGLMSRYDHTETLSKVVLIPARRVTDGAAPPFRELEAQLKYARLTPEPAKFEGLAHELVKLAPFGGNGSRFSATANLMGELVSTVEIARTSDRVLEFVLPSGMRVPLEALGFAERNAFVLAATVVLLGLQRSVILLDTPELGLPPGVAARWLGALAAAAPEAQWIVASRDPAVLQSVGASARIELAGGTS